LVFVNHGITNYKTQDDALPCSQLSAAANLLHSPAVSILQQHTCWTPLLSAQCSSTLDALPCCQHTAAAHLLDSSAVSTVQQHTCYSSAQWLCLLLHSNSVETKYFISVATTAQWIQQKIKCVLCRAFVPYKVSDELDVDVLGGKHQRVWNGLSSLGQ